MIIQISVEEQDTYCVDGSIDSQLVCSIVLAAELSMLPPGVPELVREGMADVLGITNSRIGSAVLSTGSAANAVAKFNVTNPVTNPNASAPADSPVDTAEDTRSPTRVGFGSVPEAEQATAVLLVITRQGLAGMTVKSLSVAKIPGTGALLITVVVKNDPALFTSSVQQQTVATRAKQEVATLLNVAQGQLSLTYGLSGGRVKLEIEVTADQALVDYALTPQFQDFSAANRLPAAAALTGLVTIISVILL